MCTTVNIVDLFISKIVIGLVVHIYGMLIALGSASMSLRTRNVHVSLGILTICPWDDPHDQAFVGCPKIVGQDAIGFRTLGGHEFFGLGSKGHLRPRANKVPLFV